MYKGEVSVSDNQLDSFLEAAKSLQIKGYTYLNISYYYNLLIIFDQTGLTQKGNNLDLIQELTVTVKMPVEEAAESADYPIIDHHSEVKIKEFQMRILLFFLIPKFCRRISTLFRSY